jgi:hypothetical protein
MADYGDEIHIGSVSHVAIKYKNGIISKVRVQINIRI